MDSHDYGSAKNYLANNVRVKGPAGEGFRYSDEFLNMMKTQQGSYHVKKTFVDGNDVCVLYDFVTRNITAFFCSWYQVEAGKIISIQTIFDPRPFAAAQEKP